MHVRLLAKMFKRKADAPDAGSPPYFDRDPLRLSKARKATSENVSGVGSGVSDSDDTPSLVVLGGDVLPVTQNRIAQDVHSFESLFGKRADKIKVYYHEEDDQDAEPVFLGETTLDGVRGLIEAHEAQRREAREAKGWLRSWMIYHAVLAAGCAAAYGVLYLFGVLP